MAIEQGGIVTNARDAERVADVLRLLPRLLLREDARVQAAYATWRERMAREEARWLEAADPERVAAAVEAIVDDGRQLCALVRELGLKRYGWLPPMLRLEFQRALEPFATVDVTLPPGISFARRGRAPKRGESHHEDLEQYLMWWYRSRVQTPPALLRTLEQEYIAAKQRDGITVVHGRAQVTNGIHRAQQLLDCIGGPLI